MAINQEFRDLLSNLQHTDNEFRKKAEVTYDTIEIKGKLEYLLQVVGDNGVDIPTRVFAAVLCRRLLDSCFEEAFASLSPELQSFMKQQLLSWIWQENDTGVRRKMCEIVIEVAKEQFDDDGNLQWGDLLTFVFEGCLSSEKEGLLCVGLHLLCALPNMLGDRLQDHLSAISTIFTRTMANSLSMEVRESAVKTFSSFVASQVEEVVSSMVALVPLVLQTTADSIISQSDNDCCMKALVELADSAHDLLKYVVKDVLLLCIDILLNDKVNESQKNLAVEVFVSLSENCPAAVRKCPSHFQRLIEILFKMLTELEDDADWAMQDVEEEEDECSSSIVAEMALDRISCALRGKKVLEMVTLHVPAMLHSDKWQERHGGLMAISSCAEGLNKVMGEILGSILDEVVPLLKDAHPRVRYAACNAVGQLSTDFGTKLQKHFHGKVLPGLLAVLVDEEYPRVQAYAGAALVNFCEAAPRSVVAHYLPQLAARLLAVLDAKFTELQTSGRRLVLEQVVTTTAAVADSAGDCFVQHYHEFMRRLKTVLVHCCDKEELRLLRGKTVECISLMGLAVGRDLFLGDAPEVMNLLLLETPQSRAQDPQQSYFISAWARMCTILGKDFAQFLPLVIGSVLETAAVKPDVCMMYNEEAQQVDTDKHWQVVKIADDQNFAIHTSGLDDKATACQMLVCYARELSDSFSPYVLEVAEIMIPLLKFYFNEEVRSSAADIMPHLLECSRPLGASVTLSLWEKIWLSLLASIPQEPYREQAADMLDSLAECIKKMGPGAITTESMMQLVSMMNEQFEELFKSQEGRVEKRRCEEYDDDDEERMDADKADDDQVLCKLVDLMHSLFLVYHAEALPVFEELLPWVTRLQETGRPWTDLQYCLCFWDDMIETMGSTSWAYRDRFLPLMFAGLSHERPEIRQAATFGFGLMAMFGGREFDLVLRDVGPILVSLITDRGEESRGEELNMSTENAISALAKICKYRGAHCVPGGDLDAFMGRWVSWLPVWEDTEETDHVYGLVCDLVEGRCPSVVTADNLSHIVRSVVLCWHRRGMTDDSTNGAVAHGRCVNLLRTIQTSEPDFFNSCVGTLSKEENDTLLRVLS